ncbi:hypothetical protein Pcinc_026107 [Petrolisthes cinctipes]|uniref:SH2 domain-containing protein n=1 Tax=Petrolisthes cinctipes TaxID=88211 RepID=A0AAE1KAV7_PETCI|nr:hypothetical protein Pcinc_026107 [Petrolisthes cinctipes]
MSGSVPNKDDVERWTVEQVAAWLQQVELSDCGEESLRKGIDGHLLLKLREEDLFVWGRDVSIRNRRQIIKLVSQINSQQQPPVIPPRHTQPNQVPGPSQDPLPPPFNQNRPQFSQNRPAFGQNRPQFNQNRPPVNQNRPPFNQNRPPFNQNRPPFNQNRPPFNQNRPPFNQNRPPFNQNRPPFDQNRPPFDQNQPPINQNRPPFNQNRPNLGQSRPPLGQNRPPFDQNRPPFGQNRPPFGQNQPPFNQNQPPFKQNQPPFNQNQPPFNQNQPPFGQNQLSFRPPPASPQFQPNSPRDSSTKDENDGPSDEDSDDDGWPDDEFDEIPNTDSDAASYPQQHQQQNSSEVNDQKDEENDQEIYLEPIACSAQTCPPVPTVPSPRQPFPPLPPAPPPQIPGGGGGSPRIFPPRPGLNHDLAPNIRGSGLQFGRLRFPPQGGPPWGQFGGTGPRGPPPRGPEPNPPTTTKGSTLPSPSPNILPSPVPGGVAGRPQVPVHIPGKEVGGGGGGGWRSPGFPSPTPTHNGQARGGEGGRFKPPVQHFPTEKSDHDQHTYEVVDPPPTTNGLDNTLPNSSGDVGADKTPPVLPPRNQGDQRDSDPKRNQSQRPPAPLPSSDNAADSTSPFPPDHSSGVPPILPPPVVPTVPPPRIGLPPNQRVSMVTGRGTPPLNGPAINKEFPAPRDTNTPPRNLPPGGLAVGQKVNLGDEETITLTPFLYSLMNLPYFHLISRPRSKNLMATAEEGVFLLRPSTRSKDPLTLSHRHNNHTYNINIRKRHDGLLALGSEKAREQTFTTIEELVSTHKQEPIKLKNGEQTVLTTSPPKDTEHYYIRDPTAAPTARK